MGRVGITRLVPIALCALIMLTGCAGLFAPASPTAPPKPAINPAPKPPPATASIAVHATRDQDHPLGDVLVYLKPLQTAPIPDDPPAVLDILDRHFEPAVLPVRTGGSVRIQNLDGVAHDVYSFSSARPLSLHLDPGEHSTLKFNHPGVVTVGCKIFNEMQGYIYVVDAYYFGKTDVHGFLRLSGLPPGRYTLGAWRGDKPADKLSGFPHVVKLDPGSEEVIHIQD